MYSLEIDKKELTTDEIHNLLDASNDENVFVREPDSEDDNFAVDSYSENETYVTEPTFESDDGTSLE